MRFERGVEEFRVVKMMYSREIGEIFICYNGGLCQEVLAINSYLTLGHMCRRCDK